MHLTTMQLIFGPKWIFNILMCPLATTGLLNTIPHYYATLIFGPKVDIQHFNVSSCQQLASSILCTSLLCNWSLVQSGYSTFYCPLANNWPPYYAPHYYAADLWFKVDIQHFNVSLANNWPPSILCTSLLCNWSLVQRWIFNILMCPLANNWPPQYYAHSLLCNWSLVQGGYSTFRSPLANNWPPQYYAPHYYATDLWSKSGYSTF
jgi:hypothetical protein